MKQTLWKKSKEIGQNIAEARKEYKMSQEQLANKLGISRRALGSYENGEASVPVSLLPEICEILLVPVERLLNISPKYFSIDERTRQARILKKLEQVEELPKSDRDFLFQMLDNLLEKNKKLGK